jgi:thioesterase domain-containing protein
LGSRAKKIKFQIQELLGLKLKNVPAYVAKKVKELQRKKQNAVWEIQYKIRMRLNGGQLENPDQIVHVAVSSYRPAPYSGRLVFFQSAEGPTVRAWDYRRGWPHLVTGEFTVYEVPGDHRTMFHEPNVETLANKMMNHIVRKGSTNSSD